MNALFGTEMSLPVKFFIAFAVVLLLIGAAMYLLRRFGNGSLGVTVQRNRQNRLAVVDRTSIDSRRELMIVRRDNVEHLILIGGPTDVLVEANIVRAQVQTSLRDTTPVRAAVALEPAPPPPPPQPAIAPPSITPLDLGGWPLAPSADPVPRAEPVARPEPAARMESIARPEPKAEPKTEIAPKAEPKPEPTIRAELASKLASSPTVSPMNFSPLPTPIFMPTATQVVPAPAPEVPATVAKAPDAAVEDAQVAAFVASLQASDAAAPKPPQIVASAVPTIEIVTEPATPQPTPEEQNLAEMAQRLEA